MCRAVGEHAGHGAALTPLAADDLLPHRQAVAHLVRVRVRVRGNLAPSSGNRSPG